MALSEFSIFDVRNGGSDANGGGFNPSNANFATDLAATSGTGNSPVVTSASYTFAAGDVGYHVYVKAGTNWTPGYYPIASVAGGAATLSAAIGEVMLVDTTATAYRPKGPNTVAGVATVASPSSGTWGIDYSQKTTAGISFTDLVIDAATNTDFTSAANPIDVNMIGNIINVTSGTGFTVQRVEVVSIPSGVIGRADKSMGTLASTGGVGALGGALATPGGAAVAAGTINAALAIKYHATDYDCSSSTNVAGGRISGQHFKNIFGWDTNRWQYNTDANRPTLQATGGSYSILTVSGGNAQKISNLIFDGNSQASITGLTSAPGLGSAAITRCAATGLATGFNVTDATVTNCTTNAATTGFTGTLCTFVKCVSYGVAATVGFTITNRGSCVQCVCSGGGNFNSGGATVAFVNCVAYNTTSKSAFRCPASGPVVVCVNCIAYGVTGASNYGYSAGTTSINGKSLINCAGGNNSGGGGGGNIDTSTFYGDEIYNFITLTADPFTNAAGGDFSLNNTAGGGALLRALSYPTSFPGISTTDYTSVGAAQLTGAAAGAVMFHSGMSGGVDG